MSPAAAYPVPASAEAVLAALTVLVAVGLPAYLLVFRRVDHDTWGLGEIAAVSIVFLLTLPMLVVWTGLIGQGEPLTIFNLSVVSVVQNVLFVALSAYVVVVRYNLEPARLGLRAGPWASRIALGGAAALLTLPLAIVGERIAVFVYSLAAGPAAAAARLAHEHATDPLRPIVAALADPVVLGWVFILLGVVVPIGEEVFFRGLVYGGLRVRWSAPASAVASAAFFAAVHMQVIHAAPILLLGILLSVLYERTGSLVPGVVAHGLNNVIALLSMLRGWNL